MDNPIKPTLAAAALCLCLCLGACASTGSPGAASRAPQPKRSVDMARFYSGRWHEIARKPEKLTNGCVAGTTDYNVTGPAQVFDRDACRKGTPAGQEKVFAGPGQILDPGTNAKVRVRYKVFGVFQVGRDYWMLDHDDAYSWFISADPSFEKLWIFTRNPQVGEAERAALVERAKAFGYDVSKLEFPAQPAR